MQRRSTLRYVVAVAVTFASGAAIHAAPATHTVQIDQFAFAPANLTVRPGDVVVFINRDIVPHTATATDGSWGTGELAHGASATVTVSAAMVDRFYCRFHPSMRGQLDLSRGVED